MLSKKQMEELILKSAIAVAVDEMAVVSYYLLNPLFDTGDLEIRREIINNLIIEAKLPKGRYAYSLQSATDERYLGQGLNRKVLHLLKELANHNYDYFIGIMGYDNVITQKSSLKMGWKHYGDVGIGLLAVIGTTVENHNKLG